MQISLRSQMIAGATAVLGASAIAITPIAPSISLPALSPTKAAVELAASSVFANPISAVIGDVGLGLNYLINGNYSLIGGGGATNWPAGGVGDVINQWLYGAISLPDLISPRITSVGLIPNFLSVPFPIGLQVVNNWLGYANTLAIAGGATLAAGANILWSPVALIAAVTADVLTGNFADIPTQFTNTFQYIVDNVTVAATALIGGVTRIVQNFVAKVTAVATAVTVLLPQALGAITKGLTVLGASVQNAITNITTPLATGDIVGAWNAGVAGLLGPTGVPGTLINLTLGAGVQPNPLDPGSFAPSVRTVVQTAGQALSAALSATAPLPVASVKASAARTAAPAAAVTAGAARAAAADNSAPAAESAPANDAPAATGDNGSAPKAAKHGVSRKAAASN